ncbi:hypothetical protein GTY75_05235 [Streptomyces sp. SID8381]|uniref:hypothetical protein n=1 Tax=unclassified Streptomyces TaxID=2593676 RepID=UPI00036BEA61|nr:MULTISPECIES: hypothetical protein [unclassified Streptomyces]MYX26077.1 hypothetical protein [Streptomyces sp. SID8381]
MEFQISTDYAHLFADAVAAFCRGRADTVWLAERRDAFNELWLTFRDADASTVAVSREAGVLMYHIWGSPWAWRDEATQQQVRAEIRPQWHRQMVSHPASSR